MDNRTILEKADLAVADLAADGGYLSPAQAKQFIRILINESTVMPMAAVVPMKAPQHRLEKIRFASRVLRAGAEGQALAQADRAKPDLSKEELNAQLFKAEVRLNNEVLEDSIERQSLRSTIMQILGERVALDMDEVVINGDTTSADPFLAKFDGAIKLANVNVVNAGNVPISRTVFRDMIKAMPTEFLRNKKRMRFLTSVDTEIEYRDALGGRETMLGDRYVEEDTPIAYNGIPVIDVPLFPETLTPGNETVALLTDPKNMNVGIWRQIQIESDKDISAGALLVVVSVRFDFKYTERSAVVKSTDIVLGA